MSHFLTSIIQPTAVLMLFVILYAFSVHVWGTLHSTTSGTVIPATSRLWAILWIILGLLALIAWCFLVFA